MKITPSDKLIGNLSREKLSAVIQYNCIPHYRARIFELLSRHETIVFTVVADVNPDTPYLKVVDPNKQHSIRYIGVQTKYFHILGIPTLYWQPKCITAIRAISPSVVIALGSPYSITAWALALWCKSRKIPLLLWGHGLLSEEKGVKWFFRKMLYGLAHGQLLYGEYARELLVRKGFDRRRLHVVYNSLNYDMQMDIARKITDADVESFRNKLGVEYGEGLVAFTGRLQQIKKLDMLIQALAILTNRDVNVHVAFVGEGSEKEDLVKLSNHFGIDRLVHFLGESYDECYLGTVLSAADLCVIPSGAGLSIMHAMVFGTPVLLHDKVSEHFPEWEAVQDGRTGFFYRYNDVTDLADKIKTAIFPKPAKARMRDFCRKVIEEKYNPHRQVEFFAEAIEETLRQVGRKA